jgi:UDP-N-acetylglucosamine:LPS N-acetylglucosamine transferase
MAGQKKILAISSGGGHWIQLLRLRPAFEGHQVVYASVGRAYGTEVAPARFHVVGDANRWNKLGIAVLALRVAWVVLRERPDIVVSTGAAPGYFGITFGKLLGARTLWLDSIANAEALSLSGQMAGKHADLWLTQWPGLARPDGPQHRGGVI